MKQIVPEKSGLREIVSYGIVGGLTTLLNLAVYFLMVKMLCIHYIAADITAWVICFVFSFLTNKVIVFRSAGWKSVRLFKELVKFFTSSAVTGVLEVGLLYLLVDLARLGETVSKFFVTVIIIVLNYILRRFWVFKS